MVSAECLLSPGNLAVEEKGDNVNTGDPANCKYLPPLSSVEQI